METVVTEQVEKPRTQVPTATDLEPAVQAKARELFALIAEHKSSPLSGERWQSELMDWAMADGRLKVELFRFVDVFPRRRASRAAPPRRRAARPGGAGTPRDRAA